jgi:hypothetical protein
LDQAEAAVAHRLSRVDAIISNAFAAPGQPGYAVGDNKRWAAAAISAAALVADEARYLLQDARASRRDGDYRPQDTARMIDAAADLRRMVMQLRQDGNR